MYTVNPELLSLANSLFEKSAVDPAADPAMMDPAMMGAVPPVDPATMGAAPPMDPSMMGAAPVDPAMMAAAPMPMPAAPPAAPGAAGPAKMKPEQFMLMNDYRQYNMQQQLTAIMNAMGIQLPPEALVLPPGSATAPPAESAMQGGPMAPPLPPAPPSPSAPAGPAAPPAPGALPDPSAGKAANALYVKASAVAALCRSFTDNAR